MMAIFIHYRLLKQFLDRITKNNVFYLTELKGKKSLIDVV